MTHLIERCLTEELDYIHARNDSFFLHDVARDLLEVGVGHDRLLLLG